MAFCELWESHSDLWVFSFRAIQNSSARTFCQSLFQHTLPLSSHRWIAWIFLSSSKKGFVWHFLGWSQRSRSGRVRWSLRQPCTCLALGSAWTITVAEFKKYFDFFLWQKQVRGVCGRDPCVPSLMSLNIFVACKEVHCGVNDTM